MGTVPRREEPAMAKHNFGWTESHEVTLTADVIIAAFREHIPDADEVLVATLVEKIGNEAAHDLEHYGPLLAALKAADGGDVNTMTDVNDVSDVTEIAD
jgi:hypothetical protein